MTFKGLRCGSVLALALLLLAGCGWFISAEERVERANRHVAEGNDRAALIELQNAIKKDPDSLSAHRLLVEVSLRLGDPRSAERGLEGFRRSGGSASDVDWLLSRIDLALGKHQEVLRRIESGEVSLQDPKRSTIEGMALIAARRYEDAETALRRAIAADADFLDARVALAEALIASRRSEQALEQLDLVIDKDSRHALAMLLKSSILSMRGDYAAAADLLKSARGFAAGQLTTSQFAYLLAALTEAHIALQSIDDARAVHTDLATIAPGAAPTRLLGARIAMLAGDLSEAIAEAQRALVVAPNLVPAKLILGSALLAKGQVNQAEATVAELVRDAPDNIAARKLLAQINLRLQRPDVALQLLSRVPPAERQDPQLEMLLGRAHLQLGDEGAAIDVLERSVAQQPGDARLKTELAIAYLQDQRSQQAIDLLQSLPVGSDPRRDALLVTAVASTKGQAAALAELDRIIATTTHPDVLRTTAVLYARHGRSDRARQVLQKLIGQSPADVRTAMLLARIELEAQDIAAARAALDSAAKIDPSNTEVQLALASIDRMSGDIASAIKRLEAVRKDNPASVEARFVLANQYLQRQELEAAEQVIEEALAAANQSAAALIAAGDIYNSAGLYEQALVRFRKAADADRRSIEPLLRIARAQVALGNSAAARESVEEAVALDGKSLAANAMLATFDVQEGRFDIARERVARLKDVHARDPAVFLLDGDVAMAEKAYARAAEAYERAWALAPAAQTAIRLFRVRQIASLAKPTEPLEEWLKVRPRDEGVRMILAEAYTSSGQLGRAVAEYEALLEGGRANPGVLNNLAWLYHEQGDARALATAARAYELAPDVAAVADTYGWVLVRENRVAEALPILQRAAADPNAHPRIRFHYAYALSRAGRADDARKELKAAIAKQSGLAKEPDVRRLLEELGG